MMWQEPLAILAFPFPRLGATIGGVSSEPAFMPSRALFLPPRKSGLVMTLVNAALPAMCRSFAGGLEVEVAPEDLATLRGLKGQRLLLLPNHPTHFDPMVMMEVSKRIDGNLYFVAAREVFDRGGGLHGWLFQRCGVYSLIRGAVDRESFAMTQKLLADPKGWLVIFPEGEVSMENDTVLPFEAGVLSMALRVQDKLHGQPEGPPLHVAAVAMHTQYQAGVEAAIARALAALEEAVGLPQGGGFEGWPAIRTRIHAVGGALLQAVERTYLLNTKPTDTLETRMNALKERLLAKMEAYLDLAADAKAPVLDRVRTIKNRLDRIVHAYGEELAAAPYEGRLLEIRRQTFAEFYRDLSRLVNFLTLRGDYLDHATPERFAEVVIRLEQEILGKPRLLHPRTVRLRVGPIHDLRATLPAFNADKRQASAALTDQLEDEMLHMLREMAQKHTRPVESRSSRPGGEGCQPVGVGAASH
jgi:1-acyl-sn-glycerol-3-phosphate acyltransferase